MDIHSLFSWNCPIVMTSVANHHVEHNQSMEMCSHNDGWHVKGNEFFHFTDICLYVVCLFSKKCHFSLPEVLSRCLRKVHSYFISGLLFNINLYIVSFLFKGP